MFGFHHRQMDSVLLDRSGNEIVCIRIDDRTVAKQVIRTTLSFKCVYATVGHRGMIIACSEDGTLWAWNEKCPIRLDQLHILQSPTQIPNMKDILSVSAGNQFAMSLDKHGHVWSFGNNLDGRLGMGDNLTRYKPSMISGLSNITMLSCGACHTIGLDVLGRVWTFGNNSRG
jgi:alpha-tubulin suppressor-like RCC1 family protein